MSLFSPLLLQDYVTERAERSAASLAVAAQDEQISYGELESRSNRLARGLCEIGCRQGDRICLLIPKSISTIVAMLAVLKAGCIYVPLDPNSPAARLATIIDSCDTQWLLAGKITSAVNGLIAKRPALRVGWMDGTTCPDELLPAFLESQLSALPPERPSCHGTQDDTAHILFTSGSTGQPKGVPITHRNVLSFLAWSRNYFGMTASDRNSGHSPFHFDLSTFDIYGSLATGAELHLVPPETNLLPNKLAEFIRRKELTQWFSVPSALTYMAKFDVVKHNDFPSLMRLLWCGEVLPTPTLIYWMERLPHVRFTNLYGPTEATIASSYYTVPAPPTDRRAAIPIGRGCEGEQLLVLDSNLQNLPVGKIGDLYIAGNGLSPGYWRDPEKTRSAFLKSEQAVGGRLYRTGDLAFSDAEGLVHFVGRSDTQIKSRGHRIELGEIEAALHSLASVAESAVVAIETDGFEGRIICCAYAPGDQERATPAVAVLRDHLRQLLPAYMLPSLWLQFDALPKNQNGKIDRQVLRENFQAVNRTGLAAGGHPTSIA